jgi:hypothetical protein
MPKPPFERLNHPQCVPDVPEPAAGTARDGMEAARALARRYLPDEVRLLAAIAFAKDSEA